MFTFAIAAVQGTGDTILDALNSGLGLTVLAIAVVTQIVLMSRWTAQVDSRLDAFSTELAEVSGEIKRLREAKHEHTNRILVIDGRLQEVSSRAESHANQLTRIWDRTVELARFEERLRSVQEHLNDIRVMRRENDRDHRD